MKKALITGLAFSTLLSTLAVTAPVATKAEAAEPTKVYASAYSAEQQEFLNAINSIRAKIGMSPLTMTSVLNQASADYANYVELNGYNDYTGREVEGKPGYTGVTAESRVLALDPTAKAEATLTMRVLKDSGDTADKVLQTALAREVDRAYLLSHETTRLGIATKGKTTIITVQKNFKSSVSQGYKYPYDGQTNVEVGSFAMDKDGKIADGNMMIYTGLQVGGMPISYEPVAGTELGRIVTYNWKLTDSSGREIPFKKAYSRTIYPTERLKYGEKYTVRIDFKDPQGKITQPVTWSFTTKADPSSAPIVTPPVNNVNDFVDLTSGTWWKDSMVWAIEKGLILGSDAGSGKFAIMPEKQLSEGEFLTILFRETKSAELLSTQPTTTKWCSPAYQMAQKYNLPVNGSLTNWGPMDTAVTRGKMAEILVSAHLGRNVSEREAVQFLYDNKITNGKTGQLTYEGYAPNDLLQRKEVATFFQRYDSFLNK